MFSFIHITLVDVFDIFLVALLFYQIYMMIRGTAAINIFIGIFLLYVIWLMVRALNMEMLSTILGQIIGVGALALIIVFQQEVRKFLLYIGSRYLSSKSFSIDRLFSSKAENKALLVGVDALVRACRNMADTKTGALIVLGRRSSLQLYVDTGDYIDAAIDSRLIETIFFKNTPMHDGAMIIVNGRIVAARCVLPTTEKLEVPAHFGMRHRAAMGITEHTDSVVIIVSEETGKISIAEHGDIKSGLSAIELRQTLENLFI
jgi:TIGR00159 family protein